MIKNRQTANYGEPIWQENNTGLTYLEVKLDYSEVINAPLRVKNYAL